MVISADCDIMDCDDDREGGHKYHILIDFWLTMHAKYLYICVFLKWPKVPVTLSFPVPTTASFSSA